MRTIFILLFCCSYVNAQYCHPQQYYPQTYYYYREVVVPLLQVQPVFVDPQYSYHSTRPNFVEPAITKKDLEEALYSFSQKLAPKKLTGPPPVPGFRKLSQVLSQVCAGCHTGKASKGDFVIFRSPGVISNTYDNNTALDAVLAGRMPKNGKLTDVDKELFRKGL